MPQAKTTSATEDAENAPQLRSRESVSLRRTPKGTPQSPDSLRSCWMSILSIL